MPAWPSSSVSVCALLFSAIKVKDEASASNKGGCQAAIGHEALGMGISPHTLSVWSSEPDTIWDPSGEKSTALMQSLCALVRAATRAKDEASARKQEAVSWRLEDGS